MKTIATACLIFAASVLSLTTQVVSDTVTNLDEAKTIAQTENKQILLEFYVDD